MKKIKFNTIEKLITIYNSILIPILIFLSYLVSRVLVLSLLQFEIIFGILNIINLLFIILTIINKYYKFSILDIFMILLTIFAIISTIFSINPIVSLIGADVRNEGLIMIISYYILFTSLSIIKNDKYKKIIILVFLFSSIFQLQEKLFLVKNKGLAGHYNFFGTYTLLVYGLFIFTKEKKLKYLYLILSTIFLQYLVYSVTSSVIVAFVCFYIIIITYIIILLLKNKKDKFNENMLLVIIKTLVCIFIILIFYNFNYIKNDYIVKENKYTLNDVKEISSLSISNIWGSERGFIWKEMIKLVPKNIIHGIGIDCIGYAYDGKALVTPKNKRNVDKAHNEYLQILVTEGLFSCVTYISFLLYIFFNSIKDILKYKKFYNSIYIALFLAFTCYSIQAFANIRAIRVAPYFFIIASLLTNRYKLKS